MLEIDGSYLEGGGQIVRYALAFSVINKIPIHVYNIRAKRKIPGLKMQHLTIIKTLQSMGCKCEGVFLGSKEIYFYPSKIKEGNYEVNIRTAGSISLLLQTFSIIGLFYKFSLTINGGTSGKYSPTIFFFDKVILDNLRRVNYNPALKVKKLGYFPKGKGLVYFKSNPSKIKRINFTKRGKLKKIKIYSDASLSLKERKVAERQANEAEKVLRERLNGIKIEKFIRYNDTLSKGSSITIVGEFENFLIGSDALGEFKKSSEQVGREAALKFIEEYKKGGIDKHTGDNLIPYLFISNGKIRVNEKTPHLLTAIWLCKKFFNKRVEVKDHFITVNDS